MRFGWHGITGLMVAVVMCACTSTGPVQAPETVPGGLPGDEHAATCSALQRVHAESPPAETLEVGDITIPEVPGVAPLRGVVVPADPRSPRPADGRVTVPLMEPDFERDLVVMVGAIEPQVDELADRLESSAGDVTNTGAMQINGRTIERTMTIHDGGNLTTLTLRDCGTQRWMIARDVIDPATTGECADANRTAACQEALQLAEELMAATLVGGSNPIRPQLDERGRVVVRLRFDAGPGNQVVPPLLHSNMTSGGWQRVDPPPCDGGIDLGDLCHGPDGEKELRHPDGLRYVRGGVHGPWTATWRLTDTPRRLRLVIRQ